MSYAVFKILCDKRVAAADVVGGGAVLFGRWRAVGGLPFLGFSAVEKSHRTPSTLCFSRIFYAPVQHVFFGDVVEGDLRETTATSI